MTPLLPVTPAGRLLVAFKETFQQMAYRGRLKKWPQSVTLGVKTESYLVVIFYLNATLRHWILIFSRNYVKSESIFFNFDEKKMQIISIVLDLGTTFMLNRISNDTIWFHKTCISKVFKGKNGQVNTHSDIKMIFLWKLIYILNYHGDKSF